MYIYIYIHIYTYVVMCNSTSRDQGGDNDLTDSLIMQHKQRIREGVKETGRVITYRFKREKSRLGPGGHVQLMFLKSKKKNHG
jgi:hypothetical protein